MISISIAISIIIDSISNISSIISVVMIMCYC